MRCINRHTAPIDDIAPGEVGDFNPKAVRSLLDAGLLEPCAGEDPPPPSLERVIAERDGYALQMETYGKDLSAARDEIETNRQAAAKREGEMQLAIDELASQLVTARDRASKAEAERDGMRSRLNELESQLAAKSEPAPTEAPAPEAPAKKGRG